MLTLQYLSELALHHAEAGHTHVKEFTIDGRAFNFNSGPRVMGVVNLSADSWYRESVCLSVESAVGRAEVLRAQGADLVDVGAESTLGHAARVGAVDQSKLLLPVIRGLRAAGVLVSVETYELGIARACLEAGANVLNLTGTTELSEFCRLARAHDAAIILCYVQGRNVREVGDFDFAADPLTLMHDFFQRQLEIANHHGQDKILLDPGLGFYYRNLQDSALRVRHQMKVFLNTFRLRALGFPVCHALPHAFEYFGEEVRCAEPFFAVLAALGKTDLFRTHEVPRTRAVLRTLEAFDCTDNRT